MDSKLVAMLPTPVVALIISGYLKILEIYYKNLKSYSFSEISSLQTFDFSTLCTMLLYDKLKYRLKGLIRKFFADSYKFTLF